MNWGKQHESEFTSSSLGCITCAYIATNIVKDLSLLLGDTIGNLHTAIVPDVFVYGGIGKSVQDLLFSIEALHERHRTMHRSGVKHRT